MMDLRSRKNDTRGDRKALISVEISWINKNGSAGTRTRNQPRKLSGLLSEFNAKIASRGFFFFPVGFE